VRFFKDTFHRNIFGDVIIVDRASVITSYIKRFDSLLFCEKSGDGKLCIYRKDQRIESYDVDGVVIHFVRSAPYLVLALTDTWNINGSPRDWGIEPILNRLRMSDTWSRNVAEESIKSIERHNESKDRAIDNHIESFLKDKRREFARITNDINTANLEKKFTH
jgi:hypothetical protein